MILVRLSGGLGDQMFQYAFGRVLSEKLNSELKLDLTDFNLHPQQKFALNHCHVTASTATQEEVQAFRQRGFTKRNIFSECLHILGLSNKVAILNQKEEEAAVFIHDFIRQKGDIYLRGYFQSEKYFLNHSDLIRREFTPKVPLDREEMEIIDEIQSAQQSIAIDIRRHDVALEGALAYHYENNKPDFFHKALERIKTSGIQDPHLFVFSNDIVWARSMIPFKGKVTYVKPLWDREFLELYLMSCCHHQIISNHPFSWWGAWLNLNANKKVYAPKNWFSNQDMPSKDLLPEQWIQLS